MKKVYKLLLASVLFCIVQTTVNAQETNQMSEAEIRLNGLTTASILFMYKMHLIFGWEPWAED